MSRLQQLTVVESAFDCEVGSALVRVASTVGAHSGADEGRVGGVVSTGGRGSAEASIGFGFERMSKPG